VKIGVKEETLPVPHAGNGSKDSKKDFFWRKGEGSQLGFELRASHLLGRHFAT
jgi:hypothetical protein